MEGGEGFKPVEQAAQEPKHFEVPLRRPVAEYMLSGIRKTFNTKLTEMANDHSQLGEQIRVDFLESRLATLVLDCVDRLRQADMDGSDKVTLNLTSEDARLIVDNSQPRTTASPDIFLNRAMHEEFNADMFHARLNNAGGIVEKLKVIAGLKN